MVVCLTSVRFNMKADILRQTDDTGNIINEEGEWVVIQDPDSGELIRNWQPPDLVDNVGTPIYDGLESFNCLARAIIDGGIRVQGATERFSPEYEKIGYVRIWFPASVNISERDRVTNIREAKSKKVIWRERQIPSKPPTVWEVTGITEIVDPFGKHVESMALLERAQVQ